MGLVDYNKEQNPVFKCIDAHTCGNPVRVIYDGGPVLMGDSIQEKRQHFMKSYDWIRTGLMFEPRGHDMMSGSILYPPQHEENDAGIIFIETSGCLPMCGHGTIGTVTIAIEEKLILPKTKGELRIETPAGLVKINYKTAPVSGYYDFKKEKFNNDIKEKVVSVQITNVFSFLHSKDLIVECTGLGKLKVDVAYGGNFYAIIDEQENYKGIDAFTSGQLVEISRQLRKTINAKYSFVHPEDPAIHGCSHILWAGAVKEEKSTARNAVFYGDKAIDRSPCGTGTSARMAQWAAIGKLKIGMDFIHESIIGSTFTGKIVEEKVVNGYPGIIPSIEGWAKVYGYNSISINRNDDPYAFGFQVI